MFGFLDKAGVFVGSSIVVPPVFPLFFRVYHVHLFFVCFLSLPSSSAFITSVILAEDLCVHLPLLLISLSFSGGFLVKRVFTPFLILIFALGAKVSKCISESFGRSGCIPCRIGKDRGFIRRDLSFHLSRINQAKAGRCVTDTL